MRRLFFALWPDEAFSSQLLQAAAPLLAAMSGRRLLPLDLHVTLCFLGALDEPTVMALCERVGRIKARTFDLQFQQLEYWARARIIAATTAPPPPAAMALASALAGCARALGLRPEDRALRVHLTLMRGVSASSGHANRRGDRWPMPAQRFRAIHFYLAQSHELGAHSAVGDSAQRYAVIASWPLPA